ncbi:MAG: glycosyltransferase [Phycisphaerales bacterium JB039]
MRIGVISTGSHGDIHPYIAIGRALAARAHEVIFIASPYFQPDIERAGLDFRPLAPEIDVAPLMRNPDLMHPRRGPKMVFRLLADSTPRVLDALEQLHAEAPLDALLAHHIVLGAPWFADRRAVPLASGVLAPMLWFNPADPVPALQRRPGGAALAWARLQERIVRKWMPVTVDRWVNGVRRRCGLAPQPGAFMKTFLGGDVRLGLWSAALRGPLPGDPEGVICGFPFYDRAEQTLDPAIERFCADGPAPVVFSLGTAASHLPGDFYELAAAACARAGVRGLLLTTTPDTAPSKLPPGVAAFGYAPFSHVLPRAGAFVCHGGIGSIAQGLRAGCPTLVVAFAHDQFNNGVRIQQAGAGLMIRRPRLTIHRLSSLLRRLLDDQSMRSCARQMRSHMAHEDGAERAADEIERIA